MAGNLSLVQELISNPHRLEGIREDSASQSHLDSIDTIPDEIPYAQFFANYLVPNRPCVFGLWLTRDWKCRVEWLVPSASSLPSSSSSSINFPLLQRMFGDVTVPVANCKSRQYDAQIKSEWKFSDYLAYLEGFQIDQKVGRVFFLRLGPSLTGGRSILERSCGSYYYCF